MFMENRKSYDYVSKNVIGTVTSLELSLSFIVEIYMSCNLVYITEISMTLIQYLSIVFFYHDYYILFTPSPLSRPEGEGVLFPFQSITIHFKCFLALNPPYSPYLPYMVSTTSQGTDSYKKRSCQYFFYPSDDV